MYSLHGIATSFSQYLCIPMHLLMYGYLKRSADFVFALVLLLLSSPILLVVTLLLLLANRGKPFFLQTRPGLHGKPFRIVKFKTMNDQKDAQGNLLSDTARLTAIGQWIRSTSIDELPQLINVLKGDMSLIGPRPLLMQYLPLYNERQGRRHAVRPGITGWAQVNGRNQVPWPERLEMDVWYVEHQSFALDLKILRLTIQKVIERDGIVEEGSVSMSPFTGNPEQKTKM